jgi:hypothetical protein
VQQHHSRFDTGLVARLPTGIDRKVGVGENQLDRQPIDHAHLQATT